MKEPEPILPKPALPYESTSEEESENHPSQDDTSTRVSIEKQIKSDKPAKSEKISEPVQKVDVISENSEEPIVDNKSNPLTQIYQLQPAIKEKLVSSVTAIASHITNSVNSVVAENSSHSTLPDRKRKDNDKSEKSHKYSTENSTYVEHRRKRKHSKTDRNEIPPDIITIDEEFDSKMNSEFIDLTGECNEDGKIFSYILIGNYQFLLL